MDSSSLVRRWGQPYALLAAAMAIAAGFILWETRGQTFYADELSLLTRYRGLDPAVLLAPQSGHLAVLTVLLYKALFAVLGAASYLPFRLLMVGLHLLCAGLFWELARRRIGAYAALAPAILLLFLGSGAEVTATAFGGLPLISIAAALGMLLALERGDRRGDFWACGLLAVALATYTVAIAFAVGAALELALRDDRRPRQRWRSAWVVLAPLLLYGIWRLWAAKFGDSNLSASNLDTVTTSVLTSVAAGVASVTGLFRTPGPTGAFSLAWGRPLAVVLVLLIARRVRRGPPVGRGLWVFGAIALTLWVLISLNLGPLRSPEQSRYQYLGALLLMLVATELVRGVRLPRWSGPALAAAFCAALLANAIALDEGAASFRTAGELTRAELGAAEIARGSFDPEIPVLAVSPGPTTKDLVIPAREYFSAVDAFGSPAYDQRQLAAAPEEARAAADEQLVRLLGVAPQPLARQRRPCGAGPVGGGSLRLPPGGAIIETAPGPPVAISLRRFADRFEVPLRALSGGSAVRLAIRRDRSPRPWLARLTVTQSVRVCPIGPAR